MLREPDFVERYSWALFSRRRYRKSLKCLRILKDDDQGPFLRSYMMLIAHFKSNDRPASNHLARQLMAKGIPVPRTILDTLALMPKNYTDTLILKNGLRLSGKLVSQSDSMISFRWREGTSTRFKAFKRDKVEQVTPGSMTRALFKQALEQHKKKTIQELQGLAHWARLNQRTASDIQLLERRIRFCRTTLRVKAGLACPACDATGFQTFRCNTCEGSGKVKKECESCNGKGWPPCSRCSGQGREQCPGCKGKGSRTVRVKTSSGYRNKNNQCGDCRGNKSIRCLRCQGDKHRRCSNCKGAGKHPRICSDCKGRKEHPCSACRGTGTHVGAWAAFVLGTGCHLAGDKEGAARFWLALEKNRASLTPARRLLILDQLHHLGLDILREKLGQ